MTSNQDKSKEHDQNNNSPIPPMRNEDKTKEKTTHNETPSHLPILEGIKLFDRIIICMNFLLFAATGFLAWANWNLAQDSRKQVAIIERNMIIANDPYISFDVGFSGNVGIHVPLNYHIIFRNVGKTPAMNMRYAIFVGIKPTEEINIDDWSQDSSRTRHGILAPNEFITLDQTYILFPYQIEDIYSSKSVLSVTIFAQYDDIFGHRYRYTQRATYDIRRRVMAQSYSGSQYKQLY